MGKQRRCYGKGRGRKKLKPNTSSFVYEVECIVGYDPIKKKFLIRWKGYDQKHDTWEPWDNLNEEAKVEAAKYKETLGAEASKSDLEIESEVNSKAMHIDDDAQALKSDEEIESKLESDDDAHLSSFVDVYESVGHHFAITKARGHHVNTDRNCDRILKHLLRTFGGDQLNMLNKSWMEMVKGQLDLYCIVDQSFDVLDKIGLLDTDIEHKIYKDVAKHFDMKDLDETWKHLIRGRLKCLINEWGLEMKELKMKSVATGELEMYEVSHIVGYDPLRREFRVRWKGYGQDQDTWERLDRLNEAAQAEALEFRKTFEALKQLKPDVAEVDHFVGYDPIDKKFCVRWIGCGTDEDTWEHFDDLHEDAQVEATKYKEKFLAPRTSRFFTTVDDFTGTDYKIMGYCHKAVSCTGPVRHHLYFYRRNDGPAVWQEEWKLNKNAQALAKLFQQELNAHQLETHDRLCFNGRQRIVVGYCTDSDKVILLFAQGYTKHSWNDLSVDEKEVAMAFKAASEASTHANNIYKVVDRIYELVDQFYPQDAEIPIKTIYNAVAQHYGVEKMGKSWKRMIRVRLNGLVHGEVEIEKHACEEDSDEESIISLPEDWKSEILYDDDDEDDPYSFVRSMRDYEELRNHWHQLRQIRWLVDVCLVNYGDASDLRNYHFEVERIMNVSMHNRIMKKIVKARYKWWKKFLMARGWWLTNKNRVHHECTKRVLHLTFLRLMGPKNDAWSDKFWEWLNDLCKKLASKELNERPTLKASTKFDKKFLKNRERYFNNANNLRMARLGLIGFGEPVEDVEGPEEMMSPEEREECWLNGMQAYFDYQDEIKEEADYLMSGINVDDLMSKFDGSEQVSCG